MIVKEKILRSTFFKTFDKKTITTTVKTVQGARGVRALVHKTPDGKDYYEGQYLYYFTGEWITPFDGGDIYVYNRIEEAFAVPQKQYQWVAGRITKSYILQEQNAEKRRELMNFLGTTDFVKRLDVEVIHTETDSYGKPMKLYRTKKHDLTLRRHLYFLMVTDTSTDREYYLSVKECGTCSAAKASTFENLPLWARQGDVGILKLKEKNNVYESIDDKYEKPEKIIET